MVRQLPLPGFMSGFANESWFKLTEQTLFREQNNLSTHNAVFLHTCLYAVSISPRQRGMDVGGSLGALLWIYYGLLCVLLFV